MKKLHKLSGLVIASILAVTLAACGSSGSPQGASQQGTDAALQETSAGAATDVQAEAADAQAEDPFGIYPRSESGFLVLGDAQGISHMETNHFVKSFLGKFAEEELNIPGC